MHEAHLIEYYSPPGANVKAAAEQVRGRVPQVRGLSDQVEKDHKHVLDQVAGDLQVAHGGHLHGQGERPGQSRPTTHRDCPIRAATCGQTSTWTGCCTMRSGTPSSGRERAMPG